MPFLAEASIEIPTSPEVAFDKLIDFPSWDRWMPRSFQPAERGAPLTLGASVRVRIHGMPSKLTVSVLERPLTVAWRGGIGRLLFAEHAFRFEPKGKGTLVRSQEVWDGRLASALRPFVKPGAERVGRQQLEALARALR